MSDIEIRLEREERDRRDGQASMIRAREEIDQLRRTLTQQGRALQDACAERDRLRGELADTRADRAALVAKLDDVILAPTTLSLRAAVVRAREAFFKTGAWEDVVRAILTP